MFLDKLSALPAKKIILLFLGAFIFSLLATVLVEIAYAKKYQAQVKVIMSPKKIGVNPLTSSLDFGDIPPGSKAKRFVRLKNESGRARYIFIWTTGGIGELIKVKKSFFVLKSGQQKKVTFLLKIPASASSDTIRGTTYIFRLPKYF